MTTPLKHQDIINIFYPDDEYEKEPRPTKGISDVLNVPQFKQRAETEQRIKFAAILASALKGHGVSDNAIARDLVGVELTSLRRWDGTHFHQKLETLADKLKRRAESMPAEAEKRHKKTLMGIASDLRRIPAELKPADCDRRRDELARLEKALKNLDLEPLANESELLVATPTEKKRHKQALTYLLRRIRETLKAEVENCDRRRDVEWLEGVLETIANEPLVATQTDKKRPKTVLAELQEIIRENRYNDIWVEGKMKVVALLILNGLTSDAAAEQFGSVAAQISCNWEELLSDEVKKRYQEHRDRQMEEHQDKQKNNAPDKLTAKTQKRGTVAPTEAQQRAERWMHELERLVEQVEQVEQGEQGTSEKLESHLEKGRQENPEKLEAAYKYIIQARLPPETLLWLLTADEMKDYLCQRVSEDKKTWLKMCIDIIGKRLDPEAKPEAELETQLAAVKILEKTELEADDIQENTPLSQRRAAGQSTLLGDTDANFARENLEHLAKGTGPLTAERLITITVEKLYSLHKDMK